MLKQTLIILLVLSLGVSIAAAQQSDTLSCDPYQIGQGGTVITTSMLQSAATTTSDSKVMDQINFNPAVLMTVVNEVNGIDQSTATFANPATNLHQDEYAVVTRQDDLLNVYPGVCTEAAPVAKLAAGMRVTVLDGPIASEGFSWWRVRRNGITGWAIEGEGTDIWLHGV